MNTFFYLMIISSYQYYFRCKSFMYYLLFYLFILSYLVSLNFSNPMFYPSSRSPQAHRQSRATSTADAPCPSSTITTSGTFSRPPASSTASCSSSPWRTATCTCPGIGYRSSEGFAFQMKASSPSARGRPSFLLSPRLGRFLLIFCPLYQV